MSENENKTKRLGRNEISNEAKKTLIKRTIYALILCAIVIPCIILGGYFYLSLIVIALGLSTYEVAKAPSRKLSWFVWLVTFIIMYSLVFWIIIKQNAQDKFARFDINTAFTGVWLSPLALAVMIGAYFFVVIVKAEFLISDAFYLIAMTLLLSIGFQSILYIRYIPFQSFSSWMEGFDCTTPGFKYGQSMFLVIFLLIGICFNDIGGYLFGMLFGKHKMNPRISPKKTWEGFVGGILFSIASSTTFGVVVAKCGLPMLPIFTADKWYAILIASIILPFVGYLGDFAFSSIKRHFNIKDYSKILGPHGGILDRIDSIIFGASALTIFVIIGQNGWDLFK